MRLFPPFFQSRSMLSPPKRAVQVKFYDLDRAIRWVTAQQKYYPRACVSEPIKFITGGWVVCVIQPPRPPLD